MPGLVSLGEAGGNVTRHMHECYLFRQVLNSLPRLSGEGNGDLTARLPQSFPLPQESLLTKSRARQLIVGGFYTNRAPAQARLSDGHFQKRHGAPSGMSRNGFQCPYL